MSDDERGCVYVHCDHNADEIRMFYEIPQALADRTRAGQDVTFAQALADRVASDEAGEPGRYLAVRDAAINTGGVVAVALIQSAGDPDDARHRLRQLIAAGFEAAVIDAALTAIDRGEAMNDAE